MTQKDMGHINFEKALPKPNKSSILLSLLSGQFSQLTWRAALPQAMALIYQSKRKTAEKTTSPSLTQVSLPNLNGF